MEIPTIPVSQPFPIELFADNFCVIPLMFEMPAKSHTLGKAGKPRKLGNLEKILMVGIPEKLPIHA